MENKNMELLDTRKYMKICVAGSRDWLDRKYIFNILDASRKYFDISIVSGCARGADTIGIQYAEENNLELYKFPADWNKYGKRAGYLRNIEMAEFSDIILVFWNGKSNGSKHMIDLCKKLKKEIRVYEKCI